MGLCSRIEDAVVGVGHAGERFQRRVSSRTADDVGYDVVVGDGDEDDDYVDDDDDDYGVDLDCLRLLLSNLLDFSTLLNIK